MCIVTIPGFKCKVCHEKMPIRDSKTTEECQDKKDKKECTETEVENLKENTCQDCVQEEGPVGYTYGSTPY